MHNKPDDQTIPCWEHHETSNQREHEEVWESQDYESGGRQDNNNGRLLDPNSLPSTNDPWWANGRWNRIDQWGNTRSADAPNGEQEHRTRRERGIVLAREEW